VHGPVESAVDPDRLRAMLRHMALTRAFDERMYRAQRQGKTSFYMKCTGEEATSVARGACARPRRHVFPSYRQQGLLIARDWPIGDMMCQIYSNSGRSAEGPADADHVFGEGGRLLLDLGQSRDPISAGGRLRDGERGQGRQPDRGQPGAAKGRPPRATSIPPAPSPASIVRRSSSTSSTISGRSRPSRASRAPRRRPLRRARSAMALPGCGSTATTSLAVYAATALGGRAGAPITARPDRAFHLSRRRPFHLGRSHQISLGRGARQMAAGRSDRAAEAASDRAWANGTRSATRRWTAKSPRMSATRAARPRRIGDLHDGLKQPFTTMFEDVFEEMPWHLKEQIRRCRTSARRRGYEQRFPHKFVPSSQRRRGSITREIEPLSAMAFPPPQGMTLW
jgi:2-oxoisovalerate dehydrogenase E1 component alpha subunit